MKEDKKTKIVTFRTDEETKKMLDIIAEQNKWSVSQVVEQIIKNFIVNPHPELITIKTEELGRIYKELKESDMPIAELMIDTITDMEGEPEERVYRGIRITGIEHMGVGSCPDFEPIEELPEEEFYYQ